MGIKMYTVFGNKKKISHYFIIPEDFPRRRERERREGIDELGHKTNELLIKGEERRKSSYFIFVQ